MQEHRKKLICCGWHANKSRITGLAYSHKFYEPNYFEKYRRTWIFHQLENRYEYDEFIGVVTARCDIYPEFDEPYPIIVKGQPGNNTHYHGFYTPIMLGAQYALCYNYDFVYIEQDCIVTGLADAIKWAEDCQLCYGYGNNASFANGWAEQSFMWARNDFLPEFIARINRYRLHEVSKEWTEKIFHQVFQDRFVPWPFGYGRKKFAFDNVDNILYKQQCTDKEFDYLLKRIYNGSMEM